MFEERAPLSIFDFRFQDVTHSQFQTDVGTRRFLEGKYVMENGQKKSNQMGREALEGLHVSPKPAASRKINKRIISHPLRASYSTN